VKHLLPRGGPASESHELSTPDVSSRTAAEASLDALDAADMARLSSGEATALDGLMQRHRRWLLKWLLSMLGDASEALEVFQDTFLRVYLYRHKFQTQRCFHPWLCTISLNLARTRLRWRLRQPSMISLPDEGGNDGGPETIENDLIDPCLSPEARLEQQEWLDALEGAVATLPAKLRVPLERFAFDDLSHAQVAAELGCSPKTVEMRIYHARQQIRDHLEDCAIKSEGFRLPSRKQWKAPLKSAPA
jgi:RNA polymerase sigma-70 factor (ECF subfamily)